jgi:hypothetical protein
MTPNGIEVLLHCHTSPTPHPRVEARAVRDALAMLEDDGMIVSAPGTTYTTTSRGAAHVKQLCRLSLPTQAWIGADGGLL